FQNSRDLIRIYYNRVLFANHYFTFDRAGWKSDRGMIYIIMGPPEEVIRDEMSEQWVYKSLEANRKYIFKFTLRNNSLGSYDFILNRNEDYRVIWQMAIDSWRKGKIFSL
ncbi:MAG: GWxTD domain-containing protein, partial [Bacteroidales bacterium]|nr:GWxTD domain-containing protein [Bacteroidales bacterium]